MTDTPQHIQDLHLQIWLSKSLSERLYLALKSNEELFIFSKKAREQMKKSYEGKPKDASAHNS